eukprot:11924028-Ditylum_brightwellii.AAC.1
MEQLTPSCNGTIVQGGYNGLKRKIITDCHQVPGILKAINGQGITYVKIVVDVKFDGLDKDNLEIYPFTFFIHLHSETRTVNRTRN